MCINKLSKEVIITRKILIFRKIEMEARRKAEEEERRRQEEEDKKAAAVLQVTFLFVLF